MKKKIFLFCVAIGISFFIDYNLQARSSIQIKKQDYLANFERDEFKDYVVKNMSVDNETLVLQVRKSKIAKPDSIAVLVYLKKNNQWQFVQELVAPNGEVSDSFGDSIKISGDIIAIGAYAEDNSYSKILNHKKIIDNNKLKNSGAVYVFKRKNGTWEFDAYLKSPYPKAYGLFGYDLDLYENRLVVGGKKQAFIFERKNQKWILNTQLKIPNGVSLNQLGTSVAIHKNTVLVAGEYKVKDTIQKNPQGQLEKGISNDRGVVYVFSKTKQGFEWQTTLESPDPLNDKYFGFDMALHQDTAVIGTANRKAYVYTFFNSKWSQSDVLKFSKEQSHDENPTSVSVYKGIIIIGDPVFGKEVRIKSDLTHKNYDYDFYYHLGAIHIFQRHNSGWKLHKSLKGKKVKKRTHAFLGLDIAYDGKNLFFTDSSFVGNPNDDAFASQTKGGVWVYSLE